MESQGTLTTLSELLARNQTPEVSLLSVASPTTAIAQQQDKAEGEWRGAIAALEFLLLQTLFPNNQSVPSQSLIQGLVVAGPLPVLSHPQLMTRLQTCNFTLAPGHGRGRSTFQLPPVKESHPLSLGHVPMYSLSLQSQDPLAAEKFCLVLTAHWSLVMACGVDLADEIAFRFSFHPEVIFQGWQILRQRLNLPAMINELEQLVEQFAPVVPPYETVMHFSQLLLRYVPPPPVVRLRRLRRGATRWKLAAGEHPVPKSFCAPTLSPDIELLQAITHEVRTPLTTIRTLTRLILKRSGLPAAVIRQLEGIDRECTEQIDRFNLIFQVVELETAPARSATMPLSPTSVGELLQQSIPRWQQQASRRNLTLEVHLPHQMPTIVSHPAILDQALTGLIERFTRNLPTGHHIQIQITLAGSQLKLKLQAHQDSSNAAAETTPAQPTLRSIGQLLMFQPETGNLSLNLAVTKNRFSGFGGQIDCSATSPTGRSSHHLSAPGNDVVWVI
ncbi:sensor histidine kinase [Neosynechococcus sphagnicola]|uniref:sensor histidine kinase n=1 Tax=Neosynechococcus sphagnicola TaxID=1501145 RepID=UPI00068A6927|nr:HAMP domain-containing histidine kinase [Neosynechococcus sphagnicola]